VLEIPFVTERLGSHPGLVERPFDPALRDVLLELLFASGSKLLILPMQDIFGWTDRVNVPARVDGENWTYRLPWAVDRLADEPDASERAATLRQWAAQYGRAPGEDSPSLMGRGLAARDKTVESQTKP